MVTDIICIESEQRVESDFEFPDFVELEKAMPLVSLGNRRRIRRNS